MRNPVICFLGSSDGLPTYAAYLGAISVTKWYLGGTLVSKAYLGSTQVF